MMLNLLQSSKKVATGFIAIAFASSANADSCDVEAINQYVKQADYRPAKTMCGAQMDLLHISLVKGFKSNKDKLSGVSLDIKDANGVSVTRYQLKFAETLKGTAVLGCVNKAYIENSLVTFSVSQKKSSSTPSSQTLRMQSNNHTCKLKTLIKKQ